MASTDKFYTEAKEWSARKHRLIRKYTDGFTRIMGGTHGQVYYVDGFAGRGYYDDGTPGSPVVIAQYAAGIAGKKKPYRLLCINVEADHSTYADLCKATERYKHVVVHNFEGTFGEHVETILSVIGDAPALFFLDPFGVKGIEWNVMRRILERPRTDVWLRLDVSTLARLHGFIDSQGKGAEKKCLLLANFFGLDQRGLREHLGGLSTDEMVDFYLGRLAQACGKHTGRGYAAVYSIRSIEGRQKYYLAFACRHPKALTLTSDIVYGEEETFEREQEEYRRSGGMYQPLLPGMKPTREQVFVKKVARLKRDIWELCKGEERIRRSELRVRLLTRKRWFGKVKGKHFTHALKELEEEGLIIKRQGAPSSDNTLFTFRSG